MQGTGLEEVGIAGQAYLRDALTSCTDPLQAIEEFQVDVFKCVSVFHHLGNCRVELYHMGIFFLYSERMESVCHHFVKCYPCWTCTELLD